MVDLHNHVIFGVDDGSKSLEQSIAMLRQAEEQNISVVCCTPHVHEITKDAEIDVMIERIEILRNEIVKNKINIELVLGCEIMFHPRILETVKKFCGTYNDMKSYCLVEFPAFDFPDVTGELVYELNMEGITMIIAHPERNGRMAANLDELFNLVKYGALLQMDIGSLLGDFGSSTKKACEEIFSYDAYSFAASDSHSLGKRCFLMDKGYEVISNLKSPEVADLLLKTNPRKVIEGIKIDNDIIWQNFETQMNAKSQNGFMSKIKRIFGSFS
ncbi:MAG: hypothetical protein DWQ06_12425 [Calditrichaeota bacterium]|nr:MAG: hypothetical protein DWQ06_12425 [Calditrichota bacterium]